MTKTLIIILLSTIPLTLNANDGIIAEIEANNLKLKALRAKTEALSEENLADATLEDPSLEFAYLWGPGGIGRKDISVSQSFDYATIFGLRKDKALSENELLQLEYKLSLRDIKLQVKNLINEIIYRNALIEQYERRLELATQNEEAYKKGLKLGEFSIIDYRNASLELSQVQNSYDQLKIERSKLLNDLSLLNGGKAIEITDTELIIPLLPSNFDTWLEEASQNSSSLEYYRSSTQASEQELRLRKGEAVPALSIGYAAELVPESNFRGIQFGISLPLWSSGKKIKAAKMKLEASRAEEQAAIYEFGLKAKSLYNKALSLSEVAAFFTDDSIIYEIEEALKAGQINIIESIESMKAYYDTLELNLTNRLNCILTINELEFL